MPVAEGGLSVRTVGKRLQCFKLLRLRKDGSLGPLFINQRQRIPIGQWLDAEDHPTKGYAHRPGWHCAAEQKADHLSTKGRVWAEVEIEDYYEFPRPKHQGGCWLIANKMRVVRLLPGEGEALPLSLLAA